MNLAPDAPKIRRMTADALRRWSRGLLRLVAGVPFLVTVAVLAVLVVAYTLAGFFLVPRLIRAHVPRFAQEQLNRRAEIGEAPQVQPKRLDSRGAAA